MFYNGQAFVMCTMTITIHPYKLSVPLNGTSTNSTKPDQTPQNAASDHVLPFLLTDCAFEISMKLKLAT